MNPRHMLRNESIEFEVARQMPNQQHPEPYILLGGAPHFPQSSVHQIIPPGSINNIDFHRLPENETTLHISPQYPHQVHPVGNLELGIPTPSNFYNTYLNPASGVRLFSGPMDQLPSSSNLGPSAAHAHGYGMNSFAPEGFRGLSKRNGEGYMGNIQYFSDPSAPTTVSVPPISGSHIDDPMPQRGNYVGPSFQPPSATWCERHPNGVGDSSTLSFNCPPFSPYLEASNVNVNVNGNSSEIGTTGPLRFHESASTSRGSLNLFPYTPVLHPMCDFHPQYIHGGYNSSYRHPAAPSSSRHSINNTLPHTNISYPQQGHEAVPRPPGMRIYRSHRRNNIPEGFERHHNLPHFRFLQDDGVAILEFPDHYETSSSMDQHRDMRLDIDYMSYEELLALSERIGNVKTGLSEESINAHLKTYAHRSSMSTIDVKELACIDDKKDSCVICQDEYEENDKIGSLMCGHEYHVDCLKKWLLLKNTCPICKSLALNVEQKSE